jgi:hypothetical protein
LNGDLTGYANGLPKKSWLLKFENDNSNQPIQKVIIPN